MGSFHRTLTGLGLAAVLAIASAVTAGAEVVFHRGNDGEPESVDPHKVSGTWENRVVGDMFEGLVTENAKAEPIPGQAESWTISDDGLVYTFTLREDARWSNSEPVTAHDFEFAFKRILAPATAAKYATLLYPIKGAEAYNSGAAESADVVGARALDDRTLEVILENPTPYFITQLKHYTAYPVPRDLVEEHGDQWTKAENIASNGPYRMVEWVPNSTITLVKNDQYHDADNVAIDRVVFHQIEDRSEGLKRFRAGEILMYPEFPVRQYGWLQENMPDKVRTSPYLGIYYYTVNTLREPFDNPAVRRALSLVIDRAIITDKIMGTGEVPAYSFVPLGALNYEPAYADFKDTPMADRIAEAQALMAEAGYGPDNPLRFTLSYNTSENHRQVAIAISAMWKQALGVEAELYNSEVAVHYNDLQNENYDVGRAGWIGDYNDAQNFLFKGESRTAKLNYPRYSNAEFDALMRQAGETIDLEARAELMHQAEAIMMADMPYIPIYYYISRNLVSPQLQGFEDNIEDIHRTRWMSIAE